MTGHAYRRSAKGITGAFLTFVLSGALLLTAGILRADWFGTFSVQYGYEYDYVPDRSSREHRAGIEMDDWLERGNATVTASPIFDEGIRVAAWAEGGDSPDSYDFGLASAIYLFDIPRDSRQINVRIRYDGSGTARDLDDYEIAGRVWIRNFDREHSNDPDEPVPGDTFLLRANRRSETLRIPVAGHVNDRDQMELHIVADGSNRVDVDYLEVETFERVREVRVIRRYVPTYQWRPWSDYTYVYFYGGPCYFPTDYGYYLYWDYPYDSDFVVIRRNYRSYLYGSYALRYPGTRLYVRDYSIYDRPSGRYVTRWTPQLNTVRDQYERGRTKARRPPDEALQMRENVSSAIRQYRQAPATTQRTTGSAKTRRDAPANRRALTAPSRSDSRDLGSTKNRRGSDLESLPESARRSRTEPNTVQRVPSASDDAKRRRAASQPDTYSAPRRESPPSSSRSSAPSSSSETKRRREEAPKAESKPKAAPSTPSSSNSSSKDDEEEKKKRRK